MSMTTRFRPASGLRKLTWAQVELIDQIVAEMCGLSETTGDEVQVRILITGGHPRRIERPLVTSSLKPVVDL